MSFIFSDYLEDEPTEITKWGTQIWKNKNGKIHRENDLPAIIHNNGIKIWYLNGVRYRINGPAWTHPYGSEEYWKNGIEIRNYER